MDNNIFEITKILFEIIKILILIFGLIYVIKRFNHNKLRTASHENLKSLINIYNDLYDNQDRLNCYGISIDELKSKNIKVEEFIHLLKDFTAGQIYYDMYGKPKNGLFDEESYRYNLCSLESTKISWPYLKKFFGGTDFSELCEDTINHVSSSNCKNTDLTKSSSLTP